MSHQSRKQPEPKEITSRVFRLGGWMNTLEVHTRENDNQKESSLRFIFGSPQQKDHFLFRFLPTYEPASLKHSAEFSIDMSTKSEEFFKQFLYNLQQANFIKKTQIAQLWQQCVCRESTLFEEGFKYSINQSLNKKQYVHALFLAVKFHQQFMREDSQFNTNHVLYSLGKYFLKRNLMDLARASFGFIKPADNSYWYRDAQKKIEKINQQMISVVIPTTLTRCSSNPLKKRTFARRGSLQRSPALNPMLPIQVGDIEPKIRYSMPRI